MKRDKYMGLVCTRQRRWSLYWMRKARPHWRSGLKSAPLHCRPTTADSRSRHSRPACRQFRSGRA